MIYLKWAAVIMALTAAAGMAWVKLQQRRSFPDRRVWVRAYGDVGAWHNEMCLVARFPDPGTWENGGFPWCTCRGRT